MGIKDNIRGVINTFLEKYNLEQDKVKVPDEDRWVFKLGSFNFQLFLTDYNQLGTPRTGIVIGGKILDMPEDESKKNALIQELLELNSKAVGVYFATNNENVLLLSSRDADGLDYDEFELIIQTVAGYGDYFDNTLTSKYS
jgi:hypothetical protein